MDSVNPSLSYGWGSKLSQLSFRIQRVAKLEPEPALPTWALFLQPMSVLCQQPLRCEVHSPVHVARSPSGTFSNGFNVTRHPCHHQLDCH